MFRSVFSRRQPMPLLWIGTKTEVQPLTTARFVGRGAWSHSIGAMGYAPVDVVEAHDVVLAQIAADLYLDQFKPNLAGVGEPMDAADRDVDGFVFVHAALVSAERHFGRPLDHDPMLGSVEMLLQGQLAAWLHDDPVHPVARGNVDVLRVTPRAVDPAMLDRRAMIVAGLASGEMKCDGQTAEIGLQLNLGGEELLPRPPWADQLALQ